MIERAVVDGRRAAVAYLNRDLEPASKEDAEILKVLFDDNETVFLTVPNRDLGKSSDHGADLHVMPERAVPIQLVQPVADVVTRANVQHVSWEMVREGRDGTHHARLPLAALIPTQQVVDSARVAKHEAALRSGEDDPRPPLVLEWAGDYYLLGGHHGMQAARNVGVEDVAVDLMVAPE